MWTQAQFGLDSRGRRGAQRLRGSKWSPADLGSLLSPTQPYICIMGTLRKCASYVVLWLE